MEIKKPNKLEVGDGAQLSEIQRNLLIHLDDTKTIYDNFLNERDELFDLVQNGAILEEIKKGRLTTKK